MSDSNPNQHIPDPAAQKSGGDDTSIVPDPTIDPVERERARTRAIDDHPAEKDVEGS